MKKRMVMTGAVIALMVLALAGCAAAPVTAVSEMPEASSSQGSESAAPATESTETGSETKAEYRKISAEDAKARMDAGDVIVLDVRTPEEYAQGYIEGAILLPDYEIAGKAETVLADKDATILLYCRSGNRSAGAAKKLVEMGYTDVYDFGGIFDWPYEVVKD